MTNILVQCVVALIGPGQWSVLAILMTNDCIHQNISM